ncbi:MAG: cupin domain-containing protein [Alphaproteobacteria bacterium]|nr:cupin domain-containing protein [Alphaproteobacteria bacterium]MBU1552288.1 cupin domain-containing protein [Alphaproteobacteria bacterium]MBU2336804.1 cupin domain-containing protein [Alphaproteobacteria bacterium]MBU2389560.1 cupin domain-containing protein [Alphaproteobacteria bacterium]
MDIRRSGSVPSRRAPSEYFTGSVWQDAIVEAEAPARVRSVIVRFDPGARTNWHTHPLGQTLHVVGGCGLIQKEGEPIQPIHPGDTVWIAPGEKHWHGAGLDTAMTHIAIHEALDGSNAEWLEPVSDEQYSAAPRRTP